MTQTLEKRAETIAMGRMKLGPIGEFVPVPYDELKELALVHLRAVERAATKAAYERAVKAVDRKSSLPAVTQTDMAYERGHTDCALAVLRALADGGSDG